MMTLTSCATDHTVWIRGIIVTQDHRTRRVLFMTWSAGDLLPLDLIVMCIMIGHTGVISDSLSAVIIVMMIGIMIAIMIAMMMKNKLYTGAVPPYLLLGIDTMINIIIKINKY